MASSSDRIDEKGKRKQQDKEKSVDREFGLLEQTFRFFHGFFFLESFPEDQKKIEEDKGRKINEGLKFIRVGKDKITDEKEKGAQKNPKVQGFCRVFAERGPVVFRFVFEKPKLREPFGYHQKIAENPPRQ